AAHVKAARPGQSGQFVTVRGSSARSWTSSGPASHTPGGSLNTPSAGTGTTTGARPGARARYRAAASPPAFAPSLIVRSLIVRSRIVSWPELISAPPASGRGRGWGGSGGG